MTELVTFGETPLRLSAPDNRRLTRAERVDLYVDGEESNVAVATSCLGARATWVSKLPDEPAGRRVVADLRRHGIETDVTWTDDGRVGVVYHEAGATPRPERRWHDRGDAAVASITPGDLPMDRVQSADVVFSGVGTPATSEGAAETTEAMLRAGSGGGGIAALDLDYDPGRHDPGFLGQLLSRLLADADVLFANEDDAREVLDVTGKPRELANTVVAEYDLEIAVITRSEFGAVLMQDTPGTNVIHEREAVETETVDPSGTREAFVGGFLASLAADGDPAEALTYGVATAAVSRTLPGPLLTTTPAAVEPIADQVRQASR
jgi:2-dehydro-3-deoxygluconokinase